MVQYQRSPVGHFHFGPASREGKPFRGTLAGLFFGGEMVDSCRRPVVERFWAKVEKTSDCWLWSGGKTKAGYGQINIDGKPIYTHRFSWELHNKKKIPPKTMVLHHCDNPPCIRPSHIYVGTAHDNSRDCISRGRARHPIMLGEDIGTAKLTDLQIKEIRSKYKTIKMLAEEYGVSEGTIHFILKKQTWRHV